MSMETELEDLNLCRTYLMSQLEDPQQSSAAPRRPGPAITLSYEAGTGAHEIAQQLTRTLQETESEERCAWTIFDRQLIEKVLEDHHLPKRLAKLLPEDRRSYIRDVVDELVGLRPPSWVIGPEIVETVLHLADAGHVILVGRGANLITARMPNVFHVRLIGSLQRRIARAQKLKNLTPEEAARFIEQEDHARSRYVKAQFHLRVEDPLHYHLVINTDLISSLDAASLISDGAQRCFQDASVSVEESMPSRPL
jgi:hypothetical protein